MFKKISNKFFKKFKHLRTSQKKRIFKGFCLGSIFVFIFSINISRLGLFSEKIFDFFSIFLPITLIFYFGFEKVRTKKLEKFDISKTLLYFLPLLVFILIKSIILQLEQIDMFMCVGSICIFWILASILENKKDLNFFIFVTMLYGIFESFIFLKQTDLLSNQNLLLKIADISATNIISSKLLLDISANYFLNLLALIFFIFTLPIAQNRRFANIYKIFAIFVCLFMFIILYNSFSYTSLIIFFIFCISYPFIFKSIDKNIQILKILAFFILAFLGSFLFLKNNFTYSGNKEKTYIEYFYHEQESQSANKIFAEKTLYENL